MNAIVVVRLLRPASSFVTCGSKLFAFEDCDIVILKLTGDVIGATSSPKQERIVDGDPHVIEDANLGEHAEDVRSVVVYVMKSMAVKQVGEHINEVRAGVEAVQQH